MKSLHSALPSQQPKSCSAVFVDGRHEKDDLMAAEIRPPFDPDAVVQWVRLRRPFCRMPVLLAVDARRLPALEGSAEA
jgi:hypothetical protein